MSTREHNPAMGPCDVPALNPCDRCGRETRHDGALCSMLYCGGHGRNVQAARTKALADASPSETTGGEVVAWQVVDAGGRIAHGAAYSNDPYAAEIECRQWCEKFNSELQSYTHLARPCTMRPLYSAPPAGDGVPEVTEATIARLRTDVDYNTAIQQATGLPARDAEYMAEVLAAVEYVAALSYCATRQGEGKA